MGNKILITGEYIKRLVEIILVPSLVVSTKDVVPSIVVCAAVPVVSVEVIVSVDSVVTSTAVVVAEKKYLK